MKKVSQIAEENEKFVAEHPVATGPALVTPGLIKNTLEALITTGRTYVLTRSNTRDPSFLLEADSHTPDELKVKQEELHKRLDSLNAELVEWSEAQTKFTSQRNWR